MRFRPKVAASEFEAKVEKIRSWLTRGEAVQVVVMFRGREVAHPRLGRAILDRVAAMAADVGHIEHGPEMTGREMTMILGPERRSGGAGVREPRRPAPGSPGETRTLALPHVTGVLCL